MFKTYSFQDVDISFNHPAIGSYSAAGEGVGDLTISYANDGTVHDVAADGAVMVSKVISYNGTIAINAQQTSSINEWLLRWYRYVRSAASSQWALATVTVRDRTNGSIIVCSGVSPQKSADKTYQAQGQRWSWNLMAANISE